MDLDGCFSEPMSSLLMKERRRQEQSMEIPFIDSSDPSVSSPGPETSVSFFSPDDDPMAVDDDSKLSFTLSKLEQELRASAYDYEHRYCGHCNTTTDIKEANFFGRDGQYIIAGSDDGSFFIWDKVTCNIVRVLKGDESIVNCLQPHPTNCLLATSGIDTLVRLWTPQPEGIFDDRVVADTETAAQANQKRMNADPLEVMLLNLGYRVAGGGNAPDSGSSEGQIQCAQS